MTPNQQELVEKNAPLITHILAKSRVNLSPHYGVDYNDLWQMCAVNLCKAAINFDPSLGYAFSTYASAWIEGAIMRFLRDTKRPIRRANFLPERLDALIPGTNGVPFVDLLSATDDTESDVLSRQISDKTWEIIESRLTPRQQKILFFKMQNIPQHEIGRKLGISQSQVSRTIKKARDQLTDLKQVLTGEVL